MIDTDVLVVGGGADGRHTAPATATPSPGATLRTVALEHVEPRHRERRATVYGGAGALVRPDGVVAARW